MRLGHPSSNVLSLLPSSLGIVCNSRKNKGNFCEICFCATKTRNQFPINQVNAKEVFDLIHCDIWGPYRTSSTCGAHYFLSIIDDSSRTT